MRVRVVSENQDESKWPLYRRRTRQGCYRNCQKFVESDKTYHVIPPHTSKCVKCAHRPQRRILSILALVLTAEYCCSGVAITYYCAFVRTLLRSRRRQRDAFKTDLGGSR
jgi:hypothetical protein